MFRDNKSVVDSSIAPHSKMHKRCAVLSFHRVRETIAAVIVSCCFIGGSLILYYVLSKHWSQDNIWCMLQPLMFGKKILKSYLRKNRLRGSSSICTITHFLIACFFILNLHVLLLLCASLVSNILFYWLFNFNRMGSIRFHTMTSCLCLCCSLSHLCCEVGLNWENLSYFFCLII